MSSNTRRQMLRKSNSRPGKQLEIAESGSVLGGLPAARWCSWAVRFRGSMLTGVLLLVREHRPAGQRPDQRHLATGQRQMPAVRAAHHGRHLPATAVGKVTDLVVVAQHVGEPGRRAAAQGDEQALV